MYEFQSVLKSYAKKFLKCISHKTSFLFQEEITCVQKYRNSQQANIVIDASQNFVNKLLMKYSVDKLLCKIVHFKRLTGTQRSTGLPNGKI